MPPCVCGMARFCFAARPEDATERPSGNSLKCFGEASAVPGRRVLAISDNAQYHRSKLHLGWRDGSLSVQSTCIAPGGVRLELEGRRRFYHRCTRKTKMAMEQSRKLGRASSAHGTSLTAKLNSVPRIAWDVWRAQGRNRRVGGSGSTPRQMHVTSGRGVKRRENLVDNRLKHGVIEDFSQQVSE